MVHNVWPYLGSLGRLVEVPFTASESVSTQDRYVVKATVEGRRRAQVRPSSPRSWNVDVKGARSSEVAALSDFVSGGWGAGPWHWVPVQAQRGNMLTPREALLMDRPAVAGIVDGPPAMDADGQWAPRSLTVSIGGSAAVFVRGLPVVPGVPVTYSADVERRTGTPGITIGFYDESGGSAGVLSGYGTAVAGMQRVSVSGVVPEGAVSMGIGVRTEVLRLARPQVTWTDGPVPYSAGHGCRAAIVDGVSEDLIVANRFGTYSGVGFTVMEVS